MVETQPFGVTLSAAKGLSLGMREISKRSSDMIEAWEKDITHCALRYIFEETGLFMGAGKKQVGFWIIGPYVSYN